MNGIGSGLTIIKKIADRFHGTINCTTDENVGTTFKITIPIQFKEMIPRRTRRAKIWRL